MNKPDLIVCIPDMDRIPDEHYNEAQDMTCVLVDYSGNSKIKNGRRMGTEKKIDPDSVDPRFPGAPTHQRLGPWLIDDEYEEYIPDIPMVNDDYVEYIPAIPTHAYNAVYTFKFSYAPLPDKENPWVKIERTQDLSNLPRQVLLNMGLSEEQIDSGVLEQFKL